MQTWINVLHHFTEIRKVWSGLGADNSVVKVAFTSCNLIGWGGTVHTSSACHEVETGSDRNECGVWRCRRVRVLIAKKYAINTFRLRQMTLIIYVTVCVGVISSLYLFTSLSVRRNVSWVLCCNNNNKNNNNGFYLPGVELTLKQCCCPLKGRSSPRQMDPAPITG